MLTRALIVPAVLLVATVLLAQQPAFKRTVLQQADISVAGREAVTAKAELPTGVSADGTRIPEKKSATSSRAPSRWRSKACRSR